MRLVLLMLLMLPLPARAAPPVDERVWHVLYRRADWSGSADADMRAVGDVMPGRGVATLAQQRGRFYPFAAAQPLLNGDLLLGNLESPLTDRAAPLRPGPYRMPAATAWAPVLRAVGFRALSLANNHVLDVGTQGLQDAVTALRAADVAPLGVGLSAAAARAPTILQAGTRRIALLGFNDVADPEDQAGEGAGWGRAWLDDAALNAVQHARAEADQVIVVVHWGAEYAAQPTTRQRAWARKLVAAGADVIIGAHPHVVQPIERLASGGRNGLVVYSLGNFVFDQPWSRAHSSGAVLRLLFDEHGLALAAVAPVAITDAQPRPLALTAPEAQATLSALGVADQPPSTRLTVHPAQLDVDLRGDGQPLRATLDGDGMVTLRAGAAADSPIVWRNEQPDWRVTRIVAGDPNDDGRIELVLLLWKPDARGVLCSHPFLLGWRGGRYRIIWGGSATSTPIQDLNLSDLNNDGHQELMVLEGGRQPGDTPDALSVWRWHGWGFQREWTTAPRHAAARMDAPPGQ